MTVFPDIVTRRRPLPGMWSRLRGETKAFLLLSPSLLILCLLGISLGLLLVYSFFTYRQGGGMVAEFTLRNYLQLFQKRLYWKVILNTVEFSVATTGLALLLGYPLAYYLNRASSIHRTLGFLFLTVPLWTSVIVRTYGWVFILGRRGMVNILLEWLGFGPTPLDIYPGFWAVVLALLEITLPLTVLPIYTSLKTLDPGLEESSLVLGASPIQTFVRVVFPLTLPGVFAGGILTFVLVLGAYVTPVILGSTRDLVLPVLIEGQITSLYNVPFAATLALVMLLLMSLIIVAFRRFIRLDQLFGR
ncbi:MAG: ABC transporter permease [Deltaproteobacteria bacterium]|nr:ABC transporter permease [Deltaproteobacteria bacterium]